MDEALEMIRSKTRSYVNDLDRHFDDEYVQIFKNVQTHPKQRGAVSGFADVFYGYLETYTGGTRDIASFLELIVGAMEEITGGLYKGEDRDYLYEELRELEYFGVQAHFRSFWKIFQHRISAKYTQNHGVKIRVDLNQYRDMQYSLLLYKDVLTQYKNKVNQLERELEKYNEEGY